jgi:hypothetical protein
MRWGIANQCPKTAAAMLLLQAFVCGCANAIPDADHYVRQRINESARPKRPLGISGSHTSDRITNRSCDGLFQTPTPIFSGSEENALYRRLWNRRFVRHERVGFGGFSLEKLSLQAGAPG